MADILAEEDDDEGFGDFKFAPTVPAPAARHSSFQTDDYWSGFVGLNGAGLAPSRSSPSIASNYEGKFGLHTDHAVTQPPVAIPAAPVKPKWAKPSGAIPLSIFGEDEKEEQVGNGENGAVQHSNGDLVKKDSVSKKSVGLDDLITNLLNQNRKIASPDAPNANLATNAENLQRRETVIGSGTGLNPDSGLNGWVSSAAEEKGELDDEDEWEFMAADEKAKVEQNKAGIASDLYFNRNCLNTDRLEATSSYNGYSSANSGCDLELVGKEKDSEVDDFDWEFKGSEVQSHPKDGNPQVNSSTKDLSMNAEVSSAVEAVVHEQNDLYVASDGISQKIGAFDFAFDLNPEVGSQASVISYAKPTSNVNAVKYDWNSNPTNGSFTSDENSWKLKDAASEIGPSSQEDPKDANGILSKPAHHVASVDPWAFQDAFSDNDPKHKGNEGHQNTEKQSLPLDLFGEAQFEDNSLELPAVSSTKSATATISGGAQQTSSMSIRDLLSLYNQSAQNTADTEIQKSSETDLHILKMMPEEESSYGDDDFDDSWHFKGASPEQKDENPSFAVQVSENGVDSKQTFPEPIKVNGADGLDKDSWDFRDASLENEDEIEGRKQLGDMSNLHPEPIIVNDVVDDDDDEWDFTGTNLEKGHESTLPEPVIVNDSDIFDGSWDFQGTTLENGDKIESSKQVGGEGLIFDWTVPQSGTASSSNVLDEDSWNFKGVNTGKGDSKEFGLSSESSTKNVDVFTDDSWNFTGANPGKGDGNPAGEVGDKGLGLIQNHTESKPTNINGVFGDDSWNFKGPEPEKGDGLGEVGAGVGLIQTHTRSGPTNINDVFDDDSWNFKSPDPEKGDGDPVEKVGEKGQGLNQTSPDSGKANSDGFFDDDSWSFKGASPEKGDGLDLNGSWGFGDAMSPINTGDLSLKPVNMESHQTLYTKIELDDLVEFYCKLKDEVCIIAASHLDKIKEADGGNEDAKLEAHDEEIQEILTEIDSSKANTKDTHSTRTTDLNGLLIIIQEKFQILEDEYELSHRLKSAEDDPLPLLELLRHITSTLKILRTGSIKEHSSYVSTWTKLISTCHQELEHGATLWKQALAKNVQSQLLSTSEGIKYFLSLGEIYRAVGVLQASTKLYKPWILLNPAEFSAISASLHECSNLWSTSGLEQALCSISDPVGFQFEGTVQALLDSIRQIHSLDINMPQNNEETICQFSLLAAATFPDMKMVEWEGKNYFLKIANLWANLVSSSPPDLPRIQFG